MEHIRPYQAFTLYRTRHYSERMVSLVLPDRGTPVLLETALLLALAKSIQPRQIFEFGTYLGVTTLDLAANIGAEVFTLDLDDAAFRQAAQDPRDVPISEVRFSREHEIAFLGCAFENRIHRLFGDSNLFDFSRFRHRFQLIYVDGGHDLRTVTSDTAAAFELLEPNVPGCIVWHDYGNPDYPDLTQFLETLSANRPLRHIADTMLVFLLK